MNLRTKLLLGIGLALVVTYTLVAIFSYQSMESSYIALENADVTKAVGTSNNALETDLKSTYAVTRDYALWSDTYRFIQGENPSWVTLNMGDDYFSRFDLDAVLVFNRTGDLVYEKGYSPLDHHNATIPEGLVRKIQNLNAARNVWASPTGTFDIIDSPEGPLLVTTHPVYPDDFEAPSDGSLHLVRKLDSSYLEDLSARTGNRVELISAGKASSLPVLSDQKPVAIVPQTNDTISGYMYPQHLAEPKSYYLQVTVPRDIFNSGNANIATFLLTLLGAWIFIVVFILLFVDRVILSRLNAIITEVRHTKPERQSQGVISGAGDELAQLAMAIDPVFMELAESRTRLLASEERYRMLAESAHDLIFTADRGGTITYINTRITEVFGLSYSDLVGEPFVSLFPGENKDLVRTDSESVISSGAPVTREYEIQLPDGSRWLDTVIIPYTGPDGRVTGILGISRDITRRKRSEQDLAIAYKKLDLLATITRHDILNQLTGLRSYIELCRENCPDEPVAGYIRAAERIAKNIERQIQFTRDYQAMGAKSPAWQNVHDRILAMSHSLPPGHVKMRVGFSDLEIYADPMAERVFYALIDNSLRHGGERLSAITVSCEAKGKELVILYEDNGRGIPREFKERIFERGFGSNTGLGLFLSREILSITGMTICETGVMETGSRFEITVPEGKFRFGDCGRPFCSLE